MLYLVFCSCREKNIHTEKAKTGEHLYRPTSVHFLFHSVSVSPSTSDRLVSRSATPAGSCTVWSTESSQMARCPQTKPLEVETTPSTPSSPRLVLANTSPVPSSSTWSPPSSVSLKMCGDIIIRIKMTQSINQWHTNCL